MGWRVEIGKPAKASEQMAYEKETTMREMQVQNSLACTIHRQEELLT